MGAGLLLRNENNNYLYLVILSLILSVLLEKILITLIALVIRDLHQVTVIDEVADCHRLSLL
eukprot:572059-Rhodomonas_salina.1